jgi:hypothetical protein
MTYNNNKSMSRNTAPIDATKHCTSCHQQLPLSEFHNSSNFNDGLMYICKSCNKAKAKRHYQADLITNRAKANERMKALRHKRKQALAA